MKKILFFITLYIAFNSYLDAKPNEFAEVDNQIAGWVKDGYYPGAAVIIVRNNQPVFEKYYGDYHKQTKVHIASAGKWLAAAVFASLVDDGILSWNDPVKKWLPQFKDIKGDATLRQLLSHTAGYPDYQPANKTEDHYQTLAESVAHIEPLAPDSIPGKTFNYGGLSMQVAGRIAEIATGKPWETIFQERIASPLGMVNTSFTPVSEEQGFSPMLAGGAQTTLEDYRHFLQMLSDNGKYNGKKILSSAAVAFMQSDQVHQATIQKGEVNHYVQVMHGSDRNDIYGLGEWREEVDPQGKLTLVSSPGWAGTYPWLDKKTGSYGLILAKINIEKARMRNFNSFHAGPSLLPAIRNVLIKKKAIE
ncbi:serine hydrolase domain-containing protein [Phytobacter diazotrophicus]|uniref:serine hydrolase domain-containing protein n=1 Tax=Phytobacter diazotrophicus TaxID=395631 RepID=UPI002936A16A|nr:serine hydrolase domain-containing protein [Phytobacter diazotrophicus]MDV2874732.1 serine hydrolase domain-containing protein [Phytobacter diazotrophicus]